MFGLWETECDVSEWLSTAAARRVNRPVVTSEYRDGQFHWSIHWVNLQNFVQSKGPNYPLSSDCKQNIKSGFVPTSWGCPKNYRCLCRRVSLLFIFIRESSIQERTPSEPIGNRASHAGPQGSWPNSHKDSRNWFCSWMHIGSQWLWLVSLSVPGFIKTS